jgi:hypothetical protein
MIRKTEIALGVRVKLNENFQIKSLSDKYLACEPIIFIAESHVYNDVKGEYVFIKGGSLCNSGIAYLSELDLEFPVINQPAYPHSSIDYNQDLSRFKSSLI